MIKIFILFFNETERNLENKTRTNYTIFLSFADIIQLKIFKCFYTY